jgi:hypothetical protein
MYLILLGIKSVFPASVRIFSTVISSKQFIDLRIGFDGIINNFFMFYTVMYTREPTYFRSL